MRNPSPASRRFSFLLQAIGFALFVGFAFSADRPPNIVYILADDLGIGDLSCYNPQSKIRTPHAGRLASEGMRFDDAHSPSAVCTPTRYGILTGRYCWRTRLKYRVLDGFDPPLIEAGRVTVPSFLRSAGYDTACVGKWHLGMTWTDQKGADVPAVPIDRKTRPRTGNNVDFSKPVRGGPVSVGFDSFFGISASLNMSPFCYLRNDRPLRLPILHQERIATEFISVDEGVRSPDFTIYGVLPRFAGEAVEVLETQARKRPGRPLFLYIPLSSPHLPVVPNEEYRRKSQAGFYGDFVVETDDFLGTIMKTLDDTGLAENTLIIFTSDNGGLYHWWEPLEGDDKKHHRLRSRGASMKEFGHQGNMHYRGTKADIWEGGHRVPFLARWPGKIPAGSVSRQLIELTDLLATCGAILNKELPNGAAPDSVNILPAMLAEKPDQPVREFAVHHSLWGAFALRKGPWKMIPHRGSGGFSVPREIDTAKAGGPEGQLYHMENDPSETKNLWKEKPKLVSELKELLREIQSASK